MKKRTQPTGAYISYTTYFRTIFFYIGRGGRGKLFSRTAPLPDAPFLNSGGAILQKPTGEIWYPRRRSSQPSPRLLTVPDFGLMQPFGRGTVLIGLSVLRDPPAIDSKEYADALEEVKELGVFRG